MTSPFFCSFLILWCVLGSGFCRLGLAYAGSNREDVLTLLLPVMGDSKSSMEVSRGCWSFSGGGMRKVLLSVINSGEKRKGGKLIDK